MAIKFLIMEYGYGRRNTARNAAPETPVQNRRRPPSRVGKSAWYMERAEYATIEHVVKDHEKCLSSVHAKVLHCKELWKMTRKP